MSSEADDYIFIVQPPVKVYMREGVSLFEQLGIEYLQDVHVEGGQIITDRVKARITGRFNQPLHIEGITAIKVATEHAADPALKI